MMVMSLAFMSGGCSKKEGGSPDIVYEDMQASFDSPVSYPPISV